MRAGDQGRLKVHWDTNMGGFAGTMESTLRVGKDSKAGLQSWQTVRVTEWKCLLQSGPGPGSMGNPHLPSLFGLPPP